jgi:hypothetical protein
MGRVSRCINCGKHLISVPADAGGTEFKCMFCEKLDPMDIAEAREWAESPLASPIVEPVAKPPR